MVVMRMGVTGSRAVSALLEEDAEFAERWRAHKLAQHRIQRLELEASEHWARTLVEQVAGSERDVITSRSQREMPADHFSPAAHQTTSTAPRGSLPPFSSSTRSRSRASSPPVSPTGSGHGQGETLLPQQHSHHLRGPAGYPYYHRATQSATTSSTNLPHPVHGNESSIHGLMSDAALSAAYIDPVSWSHTDRTPHSRSPSTSPRRIVATATGPIHGAPWAPPSAASSSHLSAALGSAGDRHHHHGLHNASTRSASSSSSAVHGLPEFYGGAAAEVHRRSNLRSDYYLSHELAWENPNPAASTSAAEASTSGAMPAHSGGQHLATTPQRSSGDVVSAGEASRSVSMRHTEVVHTPGGHRQHYYVLYRQPGDAATAADGLAPPPRYAGGSSRSPSTSPPRHSLRLVTQRRDTASTDVSSIDPSATESAPPPPRAPSGVSMDIPRLAITTPSRDASPQRGGSDAGRPSTTSDQRPTSTPRAPLFKPYFGLRLLDGAIDPSPHRQQRQASPAASLDSTPRHSRLSVTTTSRVSSHATTPVQTPRSQSVRQASATRRNASSGSPHGEQQSQQRLVIMHGVVGRPCLRCGDVREPASAALRVGDLVLSINGVAVQTIDQANRQLHLIAKRSTDITPDTTPRGGKTWPPTPSFVVLGGTREQQRAAAGQGFVFEIVRPPDVTQSFQIVVHPEWRPASLAHDSTVEAPDE
jgi:hypothetical protein